MNENDVMYASPRQCALQQRALTQRGKNQPQTRALDLRNSGGDRANPSARSMCDPPAISLVHNMLVQTLQFTKLIDVLHVHLLGGRHAEHQALSGGNKLRGGLPNPETFCHCVCWI